MSLILCPECEAEVSEHALKCGKCAYPISNLSNVKLDILKQLKALFDDSLLTQEEYSKLKAEVLIENASNKSEPYKLHSQKRDENIQSKNASITKEKQKNNSNFIGGIIIIMVVVAFVVVSNENKNSKSERINTTSSPTYEKPIKEEAKQRECYVCKGTGIVTCSMCGGSGINNMGMDCGCVTYVANMIAMGKEPTRTALRWTCEHCKGTGYVN